MICSLVNKQFKIKNNAPIKVTDTTPNIIETDDVETKNYQIMQSYYN